MTTRKDWGGSGVITSKTNYNMTETPKIFISYSWSTPEHEDWVINLAERLVSDGIDVVIDKWELKEGHDKFSFMETMVKSTDIQKVLIILDKEYSEKAEKRTGGVGTEAQIISPSIYGNVSQEKFVPIIAETNENGSAYVPTFLKSRIYIDLSSLNNFEENYEKLLRNIFQRPAYSKPKLGKAPSYLFEEKPMTYKTSGILRSFDNQITKSPNRINSVLREFLDNFFQDLKGYSANAIETGDVIVFGKAIHDNIVSYTPLRNEYILFLDKLFKSEVEFDIDIFFNFFEKLHLLKSPQDNRGSWSSNEFSNFKFFIHEIFLYSIAVGLKNENYKFIEEVFYSGFFCQEKYHHRNEPRRFDAFYYYIEAFDQYYKQTYSQNFSSPMADLVIKRVHENISKDNLIDADLLCYYVSVLENLNWYPITNIYRTSNDGNFELFNRLVSQRHFNKVKNLFNVTTTKELQDKLSKIQAEDANLVRTRYSGFFQNIIAIYNLVDIKKIGTMR